MGVLYREATREYSIIPWEMGDACFDDTKFLVPPSSLFAKAKQAD